MALHLYARTHTHAAEVVTNSSERFALLVGRASRATGGFSQKSCIYTRVRARVARPSIFMYSVRLIFSQIDIQSD